MIPNKDTPGTGDGIFKITLNEEWIPNMPTSQYVIGCDPYKETEPLNFWHKIKSKIGLKYKTKDVGWSYTITKLENIDGKLVAVYKGRE